MKFRGVAKPEPRPNRQRTLTAKIGSERRSVEVNVTGVAGFLLAKCAAAHSRRKTKDWYDIAFVLLHNNLGGPIDAANAVIAKFGNSVTALDTALADLAANFADDHSQGPLAYADQMLIDDPTLDRATLIADAIAAVDEFCETLS